MGQTWDFLRPVSVHFGAARQNVLELILKSPRFVQFGPNMTQFGESLTSQRPLLKSAVFLCVNEWLSTAIVEVEVAQYWSRGSQMSWTTGRLLCTQARIWNQAAESSCKIESECPFNIQYTTIYLLPSQTRHEEWRDRSELNTSNLTQYNSVW